MNASASIPLARLAALALTLLTTACPGDDHGWVEASTPPETMVLSPSEPRVQRRVQVRVAPKPGEKLEFSLLNLGIEATRLAWSTPGENIPEVHPWLRVRVFDERDERLVKEHVLVFDRPELTLPWPLAFGPDLPKPLREFEATYRIEFERQGPPSDGTIQVDWRLDGSALTPYPDMKHLQLTLTLL
ncbi:hypothetical protein LY474_19120 [Myxococcus stipitatus]|uniref:hypothetical protein n=1 Tax=Myxococcus stipitatus TaxID=83455 RepID=UPI001F444A02|nr:hypothetical protein [Myxococcus stipitatus]MCE9669913.1 hypothetical protein [Myxococcus stipitatus]